MRSVTLPGPWWCLMRHPADGGDVDRAAVDVRAHAAGGGEQAMAADEARDAHRAGRVGEVLDGDQHARVDAPPADIGAAAGIDVQAGVVQDALAQLLAVPADAVLHAPEAERTVEGREGADALGGLVAAEVGLERLVGRLRAEVAVGAVLVQERGERAQLIRPRRRALTGACGPRSGPSRRRAGTPRAPRRRAAPSARGSPSRSWRRGARGRGRSSSAWEAAAWSWRARRSGSARASAGAAR